MGNHTELASIIIPAFNVEAWLGVCLDSVIGQSYPHIQIIIINDGSTDSTSEVIEQYSQKEPRIRAVTQRNKGLSAARNCGIQIADGELLFFLDSDDSIHKDTVSEVMALYRKYELDLVMYQCAKFYNGNGSWSSGTDDFYWNCIKNQVGKFSRAHDVPEMLAMYPLAQLKALSHEFVTRNRLSFIEGVKYEDNPFHQQIFSLNPKVGFLQRKLYAWRQGRPGQITSMPYVSKNCRTVIAEMLRSSNNLESTALDYQIVAMTRLVANVARLIDCNTERRVFLEEFKNKISDALGTDRLLKATGSPLLSHSIHPGDLIIVQGLLAHPEDLANLLGSGILRYISILRALLRFDLAVHG